MGKNKKNLKTVSFDEEIITKDSANELLSKTEPKSETKDVNRFSMEVESENIVAKNGLENDLNETVSKNRKVKHRKTNKQVTNENNNENRESHLETKNRKRKKEEQKLIGQSDITEERDKDEPVEKKVKRKKKNDEGSEKTEVNDEQLDEVSVENPKVKTDESIRAKKRKKHVKLLEDKRLKAELVSQQNVLNYLSKWKHCRSEWKFEKLKQIWLQQNLFDASKLPSEFWETAVEYFNGSKGFIRKVVLRDALKLIEKEEGTEEENTDENSLLILKRARDIVQNLQE